MADDFKRGIWMIRIGVKGKNKGYVKKRWRRAAG
jgi:hypothetical protein